MLVKSMGIPWARGATDASCCFFLFLGWRFLCIVWVLLLSSIPLAMWFTEVAIYRRVNLGEIRWILPWPVSNFNVHFISLTLFRKWKSEIQLKERHLSHRMSKLCCEERKLDVFMVMLIKIKVFWIMALSVSKYRVLLLSFPWTWQSHYIESLHSPRYFVTAVVLNSKERQLKGKILHMLDSQYDLIPSKFLMMVK